MICFETKNIEVWETKMTSCRSILQTKKFQMKSMGEKSSNTSFLPASSEHTQASVPATNGTWYTINFYFWKANVGRTYQVYLGLLN